MDDFHLNDWIAELIKKVKLQDIAYENGDFSALESTNKAIEEAFKSVEKNKSKKRGKKGSPESGKAADNELLDKEYVIESDDLDCPSRTDIDTLYDAVKDAYSKFVRQENEKVLAGIGQSYLSSCYSMDAPLKLLSESNMRTILKTALYVLLHPKAKSEAKELFMKMTGLSEDASNEEIIEHAKAFFRFGIYLILFKQHAAEIFKTQEDNSAYEDFNIYKPENRALIDHNRKWNHSRSKIKMIPFDNDTDKLSDQKTANDFLKIEGEIDFVSLSSSLTEDEQKLMDMLLDKKTQEDIAEYFGISQPAVSKRKASLIKKIQQWIENE